MRTCYRFGCNQLVQAHHVYRNTQRLTCTCRKLEVLRNTRHPNPGVPVVAAIAPRSERCKTSLRCSNADASLTTGSSTNDVQTICKEVLGQQVDALQGHSWVTVQSAAALEARLKEHVELFGAELEVAWLQLCPDIVALTADELVMRLEGLGNLIGLPGPFVAALSVQEPALLTAELETLQQNCEELQELFSLSELDLARVVTTCPAVLLLRSREVRQNLTSLATSLSVDSDTIVRAAPYLPQLMLLSPERFQQKMTQLMRGLNMDAMKVRGILASGPRLVAMPAEAVVAEWDMLRSLVAEEEAWLNQLVTLPAAIIAGCLTSEEFKQRMRFFKETGQIKLRYINLLSILKQEKLDFAQKYKGYARWLADEARAANAAEAEQQQQQEQPAAASAS